MPKYIKNSLNAGELSPYVDSRTDLGKYYAGCSKLVNAMILPYGGVVKRPGTEFIAKAKGACKLFRFEFSAEDNMIIEAGNLYMRFYKNDDRVMTASATVDTITLTSGNPVAIKTVAAHGFSNGAVVRFTGVTDTEINYSGVNTEWTITVVDEDEFTLDDTDGDDFTAGSGGTVAAIYEIVTPYSATDVFELHRASSGDVIYIAHEDYAPRRLTRVADNNWTLEVVEFLSPPFRTENTTAASLMGFAGTARSGYYFPVGSTGTLTASGTGNAPFTEDHVGSYWQLTHTRPDNTSTVTVNSATTTESAEIRIKGDFTVECSGFDDDGVDTVILLRKEGNGTYQQVRRFIAATSYSSTETANDVYYKLSCTNNDTSPVLTATLTAKNQKNIGIVKVTGYTSSTVVSVTVVQAVLSNNSSDDAVTTSMWAEGAWSEERGFPRAVTFFDDRLWWAGTISNPQTMWGSRSSIYHDHTKGVNADDAIEININDSDVSGIEWIMAGKALLVGTSNKEYLVSASNIDNPITPSDAKAKPQSSFGSGHLQPVSLNDGVFYSQRQGRTMRIMRLNEYGDQMKSDNANILSSHIFELEPTTMDTQRTPDPVVWVTRSDGTLCLFTYEPVEEVAAWSRLVTGSTLDSPVDKYTSVAVVSGDIEDSIWVSVQRVINDATVYYIEKFATRYIDQPDQAMMLDCAKVVTSNNESVNIILASDTVRYDSGGYGSGLYGGTT